MLYLSSKIPYPESSDPLEKDVVIFSFSSIRQWAHVKVSLCHGYGPNFDVARPQDSRQKTWCKKWKKIDKRWCVCKEPKKETILYNEMKTKAI